MRIPRKFGRSAATVPSLVAALAFLVVGSATAVQAQSINQAGAPTDEVSLPLVIGWYNGRPALYISTETSDRHIAEITHTTYSPKLANAIAGNAVDDIYMLTNFAQGNVIPLAPSPEGSANAKIQYTPLWRLSLVTWAPHTNRHTLRSESEILALQAAGKLTIVKTNVVINCPIIYTPQGGLFPGARLQR